MKNNISLSRKLAYLPACIILVAAVLACQFSNILNPGSSPTSPSKSSGSGIDGLHGNLAAGLDALSSYHQSFTSDMQGTYQGKPYQSSTTEDRSINGQDESSLVQSTTLDQNPFYIQFTRLDGHSYIQQKVGQACSAPDLSDQPAQDFNPISNLPPVFSVTLVGTDMLNELSASHYQLDASSVQNQAGKNGTAEGELWVAQDGGAVLKYQLTIDIKDGDFIGTRTWTYALDGINAGTPVLLPDGCLPLLSDLPQLTGAVNVVSIPGFLSYDANINLIEAAKFFQDQLPSQSWYVLPGDNPTTDSALLKFARSMEDGSGQLLVIQLSTQLQGIQVIMQIIKTHQPIQAVSTTPAVVTPSTGEVTNTPGSGSDLTLPEGLPGYPGAQVLVQSNQMIMSQTTDALDKVASYFQQRMTAGGWTLSDSNSMGPVMTQTWTKGGSSVMVVMTSQNGQTQILISPQE